MSDQSTLDALEDLPLNDLTTLRTALLELRVHEVVALLGRSDARRRAVLFRLFPKDRALDVFEDLEPGLDLTATLMGYPVGSAGRRMTPEFIKVLATMTAGQALEHVRTTGNDAETIYFLPVAGRNRVVIGAIGLRDLLMSDTDALVGNLMHDPMLISVNDPEETAARRVVEANVIATAVVDSEDRLVGLLTFDDAAGILATAEAEDAARTVGSEPLRQPYLSARLFAVVRSRVSSVLSRLCCWSARISRSCCCSRWRLSEHSPPRLRECDLKYHNILVQTSPCSRVIQCGGMMSGPHNGFKKHTNYRTE